MADRLYTNKETDETINGLRFDTKLEKAVLYRIAFALSIIESGSNPPSNTNISGGEIKRPTFFGQDESFIKILLTYVYKKPEIDEETFYSNHSYIKDHIDNGSQILKKLYSQVGCDKDLFIKRLSKMIEFNGRKEQKGRGLNIFIGNTILPKTELILELNNNVKHANSHLAIMGKPGVGKTQFLLKILADIRNQSNFQTNFIYFDYKGDVVTNEKFLSITKAQSYKLLQGEQILPINPFILQSYDEMSIKISAREKAESFASINSKLGVVQKGILTEAIKIAYAKRANNELQYPDFRDILNIAIEMYDEEKKTYDSLIEVLRDLSDLKLFWSHGCAIPPIEKLSSRTMLIDVHSLPVLKELVAYLVIERLYKEMASLPDSPIEDGKRTIRTILVIDEAHNYLSQNNTFLQRIIREGRSKGIVVFFASQSPNDYQQKDFDFKELLEFSFIFQCEGVSATSITDILGCSNKVAKDLQVEIARLEPWQVISRSYTTSDEYVKFTAEAFFKNY